MKVSTQESFQVVYSLFEHEYLGYLFESFIVQLDDSGRLTLQHQNISALNAREFDSGLDDTDYELIDLMDSMQPEAVVHKFTRNGMKAKDFFLKYYACSDEEKKKYESLHKQVNTYMEGIRARIMERLQGKKVFEMGSDGKPTWKPLQIMPAKASV
ncbi:MAG TPA: ATP-dependent helicase, partial [Flammeovirgaceae bacterium]|nr:ATP-dependent helicase [Flammeovirgaceae bacterium]